MQTLRKILVSLALATAVTPPASAQFGFGGIVFDPKNFAENVLTASRTLKQINNQITQIQNEIRMLENQARHLERLPDSIAKEIRDRLMKVDALIRAAEGLAYEVATIETEFEKLFKKDYGATPPTTSTMVAEARAAWEQSRAGYKHALQVQARVVTNIREDIVKLESVVAQSQSAAGNLQAVQAGNQLTALAAEQMMQIQELLAAQYRAEALEQARLLSEKERGRARLKRFLGDDSAYTPGGGS